MFIFVRDLYYKNRILSKLTLSIQWTINILLGENNSALLNSFILDHWRVVYDIIIIVALLFASHLRKLLIPSGFKQLHWTFSSLCSLLFFHINNSLLPIKMNFKPNTISKRRIWNCMMLCSRYYFFRKVNW